MSHHQFCLISYWKKDGDIIVAASPDEDWTFCEVSPVSTYSSYGTQKFTREQEFQKGALLYLLQQAFDLGRANKLREIKAVLNV